MKKNWNILRLLRIVLAALFFIAAWGAVWFYPKFTDIFITQAGSGFLAVLSQASLGAGIAVLSILVVTLLLGRIYCSILCPLGIMQDAVSFFPRKQKYNSWTRKVKYPVFLFSIVLAIMGFIFPLTFLMPSANFVQIVNYGFREAAYRANLGAETSNPALISMLTAWGMFLILVILVRWKGRIYCNTLCPVGTILGFAARFSLFKVRIDERKCISCGACERACKAGCIDAKGKKVNNEDCVMCMNCLSQCKFDALKLTGRKPAEQEHPGRREFLISGAAAAGGLATGFLLGKTAKPEGTVMPPGAGNFDRFTSRCIGCGLCISTCRGNVLTPAVTQYGVRGFMLPYMDFNKGECKFKCRKCIDVCPCGALLPLSIEEKQRWRLGIAQYHPDLCVAYLNGEDCGACAEHCPVGALTMEPYKDTAIPKVNEKLCIGCGACQQICPIRPKRAITIKGVSQQFPVEKPREEAAVKLEAEEDFPF